LIIIDQNIIGLSSSLSSLGRWFRQLLEKELELNYHKSRKLFSVFLSEGIVNICIALFWHYR